MPAALALVVVLGAARPVAGQSAGESDRPAQPFGSGNVTRLHQQLDAGTASGAEPEDYYVVVIGDIQNSVRTFRHDVFEAIARDVRGATDERTGERVYDRVRFVILSGDMVYEGPDAIQWRYLGQALSGRAPNGSPYPNIAALAREKVILPAIGNHEILHFRLRPQTVYKDLFDDPKGVGHFKAFFAWDSLIANPHVLYPVPTDLPAEAFAAVISRNVEADQRTLREHYERGPDGRYRLRWVDTLVERASRRSDEAAGRAGPVPGEPAGDPGDLEAEKQALAARLAPLFRRAGYGTLPVINSDDMVAYGVDTGSVIYLFLDSMARGWHYPAFARLKVALHPETKDQHRLNLFSDSPFNGQIEFFRAVAQYAREHGRTLAAVMHQPAFNSSKSIYATGLGYNLWLALGLPYGPGEAGNRTMIDELLAARVSNVFTACVHGFEDTSIVVRQPEQPDHTVRWMVSGGGGGQLRLAFPPERIAQTVALYNEKLAALGGAGLPSAIEVRDHETRVGHHYLLVHVRDGRMVDVSPRFLGPQDLPARPNGPQVVFRSSISTGSSAGAGIDLIPGTWGLERLYRPLAFVNWRPSFGVGVVDYARGGTGTGARAQAAAIDLSPLAIDVHIPGANLVTLRLPGLEVWTGRASLAFLTMGVELPLVGNLADRLTPLTVGVKVSVPVGASQTARQEFGGRTRVGVTVGLRFGRPR